MDEFKLNNLLSEDSPRETINIVNARTKLEAIREVKKILYRICSRKTVLFLSGGTNATVLFESLVKDKKIMLGGVALIDEVFGESNYRTSNEKLIKNSGLLRYVDSINAPFYGVLHNKTIEEETKDYDETVRYLLSYFPKAIAVLEIGEKGEIGGITAVPEISNKIFEDKRSYVTSFSDTITLTPLALAVFDPVIVLALGKEKKDALKNMLSDGEMSEVPARFFKKPEIAKKTILITDLRT